MAVNFANKILDDLDCYADENGLIFEEGWKEIGGKVYYFRYGIMATGLMYINDYLYDFGTDGACKNPAVG